MAIPVSRKGDHAPAVTDPITFPSMTAIHHQQPAFQKGTLFPNSYRTFPFFKASFP